MMTCLTQTTQLEMYIPPALYRPTITGKARVAIFNLRRVMFRARNMWSLFSLVPSAFPLTREIDTKKLVILKNFNSWIYCYPKKVFGPWQFVIQEFSKVAHLFLRQFVSSYSLLGKGSSSNLPFWSQKYNWILSKKLLFIHTNPYLFS